LERWAISYCLEVIFLFGLTVDLFLTAGFVLEADLDLTADLG